MSTEREEAAFEAEVEVAVADAPEVEQAAPEAPQVDPDVAAEAKRLGWKAPDEWKGEPPRNGFMTAEDYLERFRNTPKEVETLKAERERERREFDERLARIEAANAKALERQRAQLKAQLRSHVETGDVEGFERVQGELENLRPEPAKPAQSVPRETQEWQAANPWFTENPAMRVRAMALADEAMKAGEAVPGQLAYVDWKIRQEFPDQFKAKRAAVSPVDGGGLQPMRARGKGVAELPPEAKRAAETFIRDGVYKDLAEYATDYWAMENG